MVRTFHINNLCLVLLLSLLEVTLVSITIEEHLQSTFLTMALRPATSNRLDSHFGRDDVGLRQLV